MKGAQDLKVKLFADGADKAGMLEMYKNPLIKGFTTNPTLMRKAGVTDYRSFAAEVLKVITDRPISFEVLSDQFDEMERQARLIASWGENVYVKIPITNSLGESSGPL
ncbi:MAG: transaldolase, partial [Deltaproteobacteria bacterium]|nr:transaldolase [Deltaproteobacteria bacterium]